MTAEIQIRHAAEADSLLRLAGSAGWNQTYSDCAELVGRPDAVCFYAMHGPDVIGSAAAKLYGDREIAFINMVVVMEEFRGHGIATRLLRTLMEYLKDWKTLRLYATGAGSRVYSKLGFSTYAIMHKYFSPRYCAPVPESVVPLQEKDLAEAAALDAESFGAERGGILRYFFHQSPQISFRLNRTDGSMNGFVIGRQGPVSRQASALTADTEEDAFDLFAAVAQAGVPAQKTLLIIPEARNRMADMALYRGLECGTALICMDFGQPGPKPGVRYFGMLGGDFG